MTDNKTLWTRPFVQIIAVNFLIFFSFNMLNPTLPVYLKQLEIPDSAIGIFLSLFTLGSVGMRPFGGHLIDNLNKKHLFLLGLCLLGVLIYSYALFQIMALLMVVRLLHGLVWGISSTTTSTLATLAIPRARLGKGMGYFGLSTAFSLAFAPAVALSILNEESFTYVIHTSVAMLVLAFLIAIFYPHQEGTRPRKEKSKGLIERTALLPATMIACVTLTMSAVTSFISLFAHQLGIENIGSFFTIYAIALLLVRPLIGTVIDKYGMMVAVMPSLASLMLALLLLATAQNLPMLLLSGFLYGAGFGGAQTALQTLSVMYVPPERYGVANATFFIGFDIGIGIGALLAGFLSDVIGYRLMYLWLIAFILFAALLAVQAQRRH